MAARMSAAAHSSPSQCYLLSCLYICFICLCTICSASISYTRQNLLDIGVQHRICVSSDFHDAHNIPTDIARPPGSPWIVIRSGRQRRRRRERKQKRGRRSAHFSKLVMLPSGLATERYTVPLELTWRRESKELRKIIRGEQSPTCPATTIEKCGGASKTLPTIEAAVLQLQD
uniref:Uncharacterized protein n=1 Tax=Knipowitschia caucasica TaxID=637954 RepID=A0AAV2KT47_KNICA